MSNTIRNRIKEHRRVRAGDLLPHEWNFRTHPEGQRAALAALYREVGFARSLLAYELPDGRLKLIDGHLRRDLDPDMLVDVEVLDVDDAEARALLLSIDPLASLAENQDELQRRLIELTPPVAGAGSRLARDPGTRGDPAGRAAARRLPGAVLVLVQCRDEKQQVELLGRFKELGLACKALLS